MVTYKWRRVMSLGMVKKLYIETIGAAKLLIYKKNVQRLSKGYNKNNRVEYTTYSRKRRQFIYSNIK